MKFHELTQPTANLVLAIDASYRDGLNGINQPPADHWLNIFWRSGRDHGLAAKVLQSILVARGTAPLMEDNIPPPMSPGEMADLVARLKGMVAVSGRPGSAALASMQAATIRRAAEVVEEAAGLLSMHARNAEGEKSMHTESKECEQAGMPAVGTLAWFRGLPHEIRRATYHLLSAGHPMRVSRAANDQTWAVLFASTEIVLAERMSFAEAEQYADRWNKRRLSIGQLPALEEVEACSGQQF